MSCQFLKKGGEGSDFSHKKGGIGKIGGCFKKGGVSLVFILTDSFQCYLSLSVCCVCVFVLFIYTISISIICVSYEEPSLIASNQQMYDFYHIVKIEDSKFLISVNCSLNVIKVAAVST